MKVCQLGLIFGFVCMLLNAQTISFYPEEPLSHSGGQKWIITGKYITATHEDWDGDGDKDMLCGYMHSYFPAGGGAAITSGRVMFHENTSSDNNPVFELQGDMFAGGDTLVVGGA